MQRKIRARKVFRISLACSSALLCATRFSYAAATATTLVSFNGTNGSDPFGSVVFDSTGNLYGTTDTGGNSGDGTFFELAAGTHNLSTLVQFDGNNGKYATGGLIIDRSSGTVFGTTQAGSANGTVFQWKISTQSFSNVATFSSPTGFDVVGGVTEDAAGNLYGTCSFSGGNSSAGTLFELAAGTHARTTPFHFSYDSGYQTNYDLNIDNAGNLYGTTLAGGIGDGTVFEYSTTTQTFTALGSFNTSIGSNANTPIATANGNLFGSAYGGGAHSDGTIYEYSPGTGKLTVAASFNGGNGTNPNGDLIGDANGNLWGVTSGGGLYGYGTVFEFNPQTDSITTIYSFNGTDGNRPTSTLIADASGNLYGVTGQGGIYSDGNVFEFSGTGFAPVPEPSNLCLLALAGVAAFSRRRVHSASPRRS